jgi:hypothetical protein
LKFPLLFLPGFANYGAKARQLPQNARPEKAFGRFQRRALPRSRSGTFGPLGALLVGAFLVAGGCSVRALSLAELRADSQLTPERLIKQFANFKFELSRTVRKPEAFLAAQSGDCDDFATLVAELLREKGYTTRLVVVYMPEAVHVVCYVEESNCYLDYNCRKQAAPLVKCDAQLSSIATSVAKSFHSSWRSVSEFTCLPDGTRQFVSTEFR